MKTGGSLRLRLLWGASLWVSVALVTVGILLQGLFRNYATDDFYDDLTNQQEELLASLTADQGGQLQLLPPINDPKFVKPYSGFYWQVEGEDLSGALLLRSRSLWDYRLPLPVDQPGDGVQHRHRLVGPQEQSLLAVERLVTLPRHDGRLRVVVAVDAARLDRAIHDFSRVLVLSFLLLGGGLICAAALQVWVGLRPLQSLRRDLAALREGRVSRLEGNQPQEIQPLVDDFNAVLSHQAEVVERGRVLAGNLAHGLKTPLAVVANEAARLADGGMADAGLIQAQIGRMQRQVDYHTARARAAAARATPGLRCAVAPVAQSLVRVVERLHGHRDLAVAVDILPELGFRGERQDLEEMLGNLLDNAAKWTAGRIGLSCHMVEPGWLLLVVEDDGPGLTNEQRADAFARGRRHDEAVPGSGLGLGIVRDLAELYGGSARLEASDLGGLRAELRLPGGLFS